MSCKIVENRAGLFGSLLTLIQVSSVENVFAGFVLCIGFVIVKLKIEIRRSNYKQKTLGTYECCAA